MIGEEKKIDTGDIIKLGSTENFRYYFGCKDFTKKRSANESGSPSKRQKITDFE